MTTKIATAITKRVQAVRHMLNCRHADMLKKTAHGRMYLECTNPWCGYCTPGWQVVSKRSDTHEYRTDTNRALIPASTS